jgi:hypothetical protein
MPPLDDLLGWFFKLMIAGVLSFFWWGKKEDKKLLDAHTKEIVRLESLAVTEDKVREIVTEVTTTAVSPMSDMLTEIKKLVTDNTDISKQLQIKMAAQEGYQRAIKDLHANQ